MHSASISMIKFTIMNVIIVIVIIVNQVNIESTDSRSDGDALFYLSGSLSLLTSHGREIDFAQPARSELMTLDKCSFSGTEIFGLTFDKGICTGVLLSAAMLHRYAACFLCDEVSGSAGKSVSVPPRFCKRACGSPLTWNRSNHASKM